MSIDETNTVSASPPKVVGKIESDLFCTGCHYNMHALDVIRDERLDIAVVRCPECGKFQPAGAASSAGRIWLARLALFLIAAWIFWFCAAIFLGGLIFFGTDVGSVEGFVTYERQYPGSAWLYVPYYYESFSPSREFQFVLLNYVLWIGTFLLGWLWAGAGTVFLWQKKRAWLLLLCVVPLISFGIAEFYFAEERERFRPDVFFFVHKRLTLQLMLQIAGILAGLVTGRAVARGLLRIVLTRRMLQYVAFLWTVDNKKPPGINP